MDQEKLLGPGALSGLNTQARCILLGMINTGYRTSEGAGLLAAYAQEKSLAGVMIWHLRGDSGSLLESFDQPSGQ